MRPWLSLTLCLAVACADGSGVDPLLADPLADADDDGLANGDEAALGDRPKQPGHRW